MDRAKSALFSSRLDERLGQRLVAGAVACALVVAAACSTGPTRSSEPAPQDWTPEAEQDPRSEATRPAEPSPEFALPAESAGNGESRTEPGPADGHPTEAVSGSRGLIAAAGPIGMRLMRPSGEVVGELGRDHIVTQPTWSRDGRRLAATLINPASGAAQIAVVDIATGNIATAAALQPYFFYSWSYDGSRLLALGPGQTGGTTAFILDETGAPVSNATLLSQSMYVAWEPGGSRLLVHAGHRLMLVNDVDSPRDHHDYGPVGVDFLAPAWVPGTQDFLYVDSYGQAPPDAAEQELLDRRSITRP